MLPMPAKTGRVRLPASEAFRRKVQVSGHVQCVNPAPPYVADAILTGAGARQMQTIVHLASPRRQSIITSISLWATSRRFALITSIRKQAAVLTARSACCSPLPMLASPGRTNSHRNLFSAY